MPNDETKTVKKPYDDEHKLKQIKIYLADLESFNDVIDVLLSCSGMRRRAEKILQDIESQKMDGATFPRYIPGREMSLPYLDDSRSYERLINVLKNCVETGRWAKKILKDVKIKHGSEEED